MKKERRRQQKGRRQEERVAESKGERERRGKTKEKIVVGRMIERKTGVMRVGKGKRARNRVIRGKDRGGQREAERQEKRNGIKRGVWRWRDREMDEGGSSNERRQIGKRGGGEREG